MYENENANAVCCKPAEPGIARVLEQNREAIYRIREMTGSMRVTICGQGGGESGNMKQPECLADDVSIQRDLLRDIGDTLCFIMDKLNA